MEKRNRRKFTADFKTKVVLEALKERSTLEELARKYELHPNQIGTWKKEFIEKAALVFGSEESKSADEHQQNEMAEKLYAQIGQLKVENDWLKKKLL
jgi:transposase